MKAIEKNIHFLYLYTIASREKQRALIQSMSNLQLRAILEVVLNVLKGTVDIKIGDKTVLERHKTIIRQVVKRGLSQKKKKSLLQKYSRIFSRIVKLALDQVFEDGSRNGADTKGRV